MSSHEESTERRNGVYDDDRAADESWPEPPRPSWLTDAEETHGDDSYGEPPVDPFADTQNIPSYDLGPHTESVIVDLTAPEAPPIDLTAPVPSEWRAYADESDRTYDSPDSDPSAPAAAEPAPPAPAAPSAPAAPAAHASDPANSRHAAPSTAEHLPITEREPVPQWDIPPVPAGGDRKGAESLTAATVLRAPVAKPVSGWRKHVLTLTGGKVNLGLSPAERLRAEQVARARTPVRGSHRVAVISLKGGVGKTTTTAALGSMFANLRGDRVIAVDANPDRGTLSERVTRESGATIRHLLEARDRVNRYGDVRAFTSQSSTRLEVLASDSDPGASSALSEQDYIDTLDTLERFYNLVLTDCGTGLLHDAMRGVLGLASSLVVVSSASLDGARSASATLDWLEAHGLGTLAKDAVVVISSVRPGGGIVDVMQLEDHFASRCREVVTIPYDPHLEAGSALDLDELNPSTREAYLELAAAVGEGFALTPSSR
jgi:MinD-like ATPase involved in chromosome partitioning or flagellar assembly